MRALYIEAAGDPKWALTDEQLSESRTAMMKANWNLFAMAREGLRHALSEAFNSNALNVVIGLLLPGTLLGLVDPSGDATFVAESLLALTAGAIVLALRGRGLDRRAGLIIIVCYLVFAGVVATR